MRFFRDLGAHIEASWRSLGFDACEFARVASTALVDAQPHREFSFERVLAWLGSSPELISQVDADFGNPITLFRTSRFYIELLTWTDGTTAIHEHGFSGGFCLLQGASIHSRYQFSPRRRFSERLFLGELTLMDIELLGVGDVRPIESGAASAHSLFHLSRPSLSLVVRTYRDPSAGLQYRYLRPGISYDASYRDPFVSKALQTLRILRELGHADFASFAIATASNCDPFSSFRLLHALQALASSYDEYVTILDRVPDVDHELRAALCTSAQEAIRDAIIIRSRSSIHQEDHRFLLALLLNDPGSHRLLSLTQCFFPGCDPIEKVCALLAQVLSCLSEEHVAIDDLAMDVMRAHLRSSSDEELFALLRLDYDDLDEHLAQIHDLCVELRSSPLLQPLFRK